MQTLASFSLYRRSYWHLDGLEESAAELYDEEAAAEVKLAFLIDKRHED